jgi:hypothetical protein
MLEIFSVQGAVGYDVQALTIWIGFDFDHVPSPS